MTQGIISVRKKGIGMLLKAVVGCDGYNARFVVEAIRERYGPRGGQPSIGVPTAQELYDICISNGFGCRHCLVVLSLNPDDWNHPSILGKTEEMDEEGKARYLDTFHVAQFNPREIASELNRLNIPSASGGVWWAAAIACIIRNHKMEGK